MRRTWRVAIVLLALVTLSALVVVGVAGATGSRHRPGQFTLVAHGVTADVPMERGFTWTDRLETTDGEQIDGWDGGRCLNLNPDPEVLTQYLCDMVIRLPEGDLTTTAVFDIEAAIAEGETLVFAVTGGTERFRNARGQVEVVPVPDSETSAYVVFRLLGTRVRY